MSTCTCRGEGGVAAEVPEAHPNGDRSDSPPAAIIKGLERDLSGFEGKGMPLPGTGTAVVATTPPEGDRVGDGPNQDTSGSGADLETANSSGGEKELTAGAEKMENVESAAYELQRTVSELGACLSRMNGVIALTKNMQKVVKEGMTEAMALLQRLEGNNTPNLLISIEKCKRGEEKHMVDKTCQVKLFKELGMAKKQKGKKQDQQKKELASRNDQGKGQSSEQAEHGVTNQENREMECDETCEEGEWQTVEYKKKQAKEKPTPKQKPKTETRTKAIKVIAKDNATYADIFKQLGNKVNPATDGADFKNIRKTRRGEYLFVLQEEEKLEEFQKKFSEALTDQASVVALEKQTTVILKGVMEFSTKEEILLAVAEELGQTEITPKQLLRVRKGYAGVQSAILKLKQEQAETLLKKRTIRVGWVNCHVQEWTEVRRCYKCLEYGHISRGCTNADKSQQCWKCGKNGHKQKDCEEGPTCTMCKAKNEPSFTHFPGSRWCNTFQKELEKRRAQC